MTFGLIIFSVLAVVGVNFVIFAFIAYKSPVFFKILYLVSLYRRRESLFYGSVLFAVAIAGIFLFSKEREFINLPITLLSLLGLFGCVAFVSSFFKISALKTPYKSIIVGLVIVVLLSSVSYFGDIAVFILKAYGVGVLLVYYKLRLDIKKLKFEDGFDEDKIKKLATVNTFEISFAHIVAQLVAIVVIVVFGVMFRNMANKMTDEIINKVKMEESKSKSDVPDIKPKNGTIGENDGFS